MTVSLLLLTLAALGDDPADCTKVDIFPFEPVHNHASCVVECPDGDLLVAWYSGTGERTADDVRIRGARKPAGATAWSATFEVADTPGYPDCNPAIGIAPDGALWVFWPTILDHRWEGALLKFRRSTDYQRDDAPPAWDRDGIVHVTPVGFAEAMEKALEGLGPARPIVEHTVLDKVAERSKDELYQRLGWMPRVHPLALPSGRWLLPLYCDTFSASIVLRSDDQGGTWTTGAPMIGFGNIQPSLVRKKDGSIVAFMRENGPRRRIRTATTTDDGASWSAVTDTPLANPGAGVEAIALASGRWAMIYNDTVAGRNSLAVALSDDEGATWPIVRHLERGPRGMQYHYPSIIQARDGALHATYTVGGDPRGSTIRHAAFSEAWVAAGDPAASP